MQMAGVMACNLLPEVRASPHCPSAHTLGHSSQHVSKGQGAVVWRDDFTVQGCGPVLIFVSLIISRTVVEPMLWIRHWAKCSICMITFNPPNGSVESELFLSLHYG